MYHDLTSSKIRLHSDALGVVHRFNEISSTLVHINDLSFPLTGEAVYRTHEKYGHIKIRISQPEKNEFGPVCKWSVSEGQVLHAFRKSIEETISAFCIHLTALKGERPQFVFEIIDGSTHAVDSTSSAFMIATAQAIINAFDNRKYKPDPNRTKPQHFTGPPPSQYNLLWTGREYYSLENCLVTDNPLSGIWVESVINGKYENKIYGVEYKLCTNYNCATISLDLKARHDNRDTRISLAGSGDGSWTLNNRSAKEFDGCLDVDLPLTPFTNTLPIRRLKLKPGEEKHIRVIYCDVLNNEIKAVEQKYKRLSDNKYHYENVPNDFEADIEVDENGLVIDYPLLFARTAKQESTYQNWL